MLLAREPNLAGAFRRILDPQGVGKVTFGSFAAACRAIGFEGSVKSAWEELNPTGGSMITLVDLDPYSANVLRHFRDALVNKCGDVTTAVERLMPPRQRYDRKAFEAWVASAGLGLKRGAARRIFGCLPTANRTRAAVSAEDVLWLAVVDLPVFVGDRRVKPGSLRVGRLQDGGVAGDDGASDRDLPRDWNDDLTGASSGGEELGKDGASGDEDSIYLRLYKNGLAQLQAAREREIALSKVEPSPRPVDMKRIEHLYAQAKFRQQAAEAAAEAAEAEMRDAATPQPMAPEVREKIQARLQAPRIVREPEEHPYVEELAKSIKKPLEELQTYSNKLYIAAGHRQLKLEEMRKIREQEILAEHWQFTNGTLPKEFSERTAQRLFHDAELRADKFRKARQLQEELQQQRNVKGSPNLQHLERLHESGKDIDKKLNELRHREQEEEHEFLDKVSVHHGVQSDGSVFERLYPGKELDWEMQQKSAERIAARRRRQELARRGQSELARKRAQAAENDRKQIAAAKERLQAEAEELDRLVRAKAEERRQIEEFSKLHEVHRRAQTEEFEETLAKHRANKARLASDLQHISKEAQSAKEAEQRLRSRQEAFQQSAEASRRRSSAAAEGRDQRRQSLQAARREWQAKVSAEERKLEQARQRVQEAEAALKQMAALPANELLNEVDSDRSQVEAELSSVEKELAGTSKAYAEALAAVTRAQEAGDQTATRQAQSELEAVVFHKVRLEDSTRNLRARYQEVKDREEAARQLLDREGEVEELKAKVRALEASVPPDQVPLEEELAAAAAKTSRLEAEVERLAALQAESKAYEERVLSCKEQHLQCEEQERADAAQAQREQGRLEDARKRCAARLADLEMEENRLVRVGCHNKYQSEELRKVIQQRREEEEQLHALRREEAEEDVHRMRVTATLEQQRREGLKDQLSMERALARKNAIAKDLQRELAAARSALAAAQKEEKLIQQRMRPDADPERMQQEHAENMERSQRVLEGVREEASLVQSSLEEAKEELRQAEAKRGQLVVSIAQTRTEAVSWDSERLALEMERVSMEREEVLTKKALVGAQMREDEKLQDQTGGSQWRLKEMAKSMAALDARQERLDECLRALAASKLVCDKEVAKRAARRQSIMKAARGAAEQSADAMSVTKQLELERGLARMQIHEVRGRLEEEEQDLREEKLRLGAELADAQAAQTLAEQELRKATDEAEDARKRGEVELQRLEEETQLQQNVLQGCLAELEKATLEARAAEGEMRKLTEEADELSEQVAEEAALFEGRQREWKKEAGRLDQEKAEQEKVIAQVRQEVADLQAARAVMAEKVAAEEAEEARLLQAQDDLLREAANADAEEKRIALNVKAKEAEHRDGVRAKDRIERELKIEEDLRRRTLAEFAETERKRRTKVAAQAAADVRKAALRLQTAPVLAVAEAPTPTRSDAVSKLEDWVDFSQRNFRTIFEAFRNIDLNGTGKVALHEFVQVVGGMGFDGDVKGLFRALDTDHDGLVSLSDLVNVQRSGPPPRPEQLPEATEEPIRRTAMTEEEQRQLQEERREHMRRVHEEAQKWVDREPMRQQLVEARKVAEGIWEQRGALEEQRLQKQKEAQAAFATSKEREAHRGEVVARRQQAEQERSRLSMAVHGAENTADEVATFRKKLSVDSAAIRAQTEEEVERFKGRVAHETSRRDAAAEAACKAQRAEAERKRRSMAARGALLEEADARDLQEREGRYLAEEGARFQRAREDAQRALQQNQVEQNRLRTAMLGKERQAQETQRQAEVATLNAIADDETREMRLVQARNRVAAAETEKAKLEAALCSQEQEEADRKTQQEAKGRRLFADARALEKQWADAMSTKQAARDRGSLLEKQASDLRNRDAREQAVMALAQSQHQSAIVAAKARAERRGSDMRRQQAALGEDKLRSERVVAQRAAEVRALEEEAAKRKASAAALDARRRDLREELEETGKDLKTMMTSKAVPRVASGTRVPKFPPRRSRRDPGGSA